jgi:anti-sigma B factor antagonist
MHLPREGDHETPDVYIWPRWQYVALANRHCRSTRARVADASDRGELGPMEQEFRIEERVEEGVPVITVVGEIDVATAPQLRESLHRVIARGQSTVVLDMLAVTFLDSTALGVLVGGLKRCRELGGELHVVVADARIRKIFEITGLDKVFPLATTLTEVGAR